MKSNKKRNQAPKNPAPAPEISPVSQKWLDAFDSAVRRMEIDIPLGVVHSFNTMAAKQQDLCRIIQSLLTHSEPKDTRFILNHVLDTFNTSPVLGRRGLMRGMVNQETGQYTCPRWYVSVITLFSFTADPEERFNVVPQRFSFDTIAESPPIDVLQRLRNFYND